MRRGTSRGSPLIGYQSSITPIKQSQTIIEAIIYAAILAIGVYHVLLFVFHPGERASLYFGLMAVNLALRGLLIGQRILHQIAGNLGFHTLMAAEFITLYLSGLFMYLFLYYFSPEKRPEFAKYPLMAITAFFCITAVFAPLRFTVDLHFYYEAILLAEGILILVWLIRVLMTRREGALLMLCGYLAMLFGATHDVVLDMFHLGDFYISSYAMIIFIFAQALLIARRYARAFSSAGYSALKAEKSPRSPMTASGEHPHWHTAEKAMTVLCADIRAYTLMPDNLSPEENLSFLNSCLERITPIISGNHGVIRTHGGDTIIAFFPGAPEDALRAGMQMSDELSGAGRHRADSGYGHIAVNIGISTGRLARVGAGDAAFSATAYLASRLKGLARIYGCGVIANGDFFSACPAMAGFHYRYLGSIPVRGSTQSMKLYEVIDSAESPRIKTRDRFEHALLCYEKRLNLEAARSFQAVLSEDPEDSAARHYLERISGMGSDEALL
jgi:adenylate cyclase